MKPIVIIAALVAGCTAYADGEQKFAPIGDLKLQSGAILKDCRVGFRTFGKMNAKHSNAVLVPTWFLGTTADLANNFKPGGLVNSSKYYVIAVDALTNGVSTSPSNSENQPNGEFPVITIRDMVESQHQMLLHLGIKHLKAVMGISMGGMQTFQWITAYPGFMDKAIPIVGSPQPTSYDLMFYGGGLKAVKAAISNKAASDDLIRAYADFFWLALNTPSYYVEHTKRTEAVASLAGFEGALLKWNLFDMASGLSALSTQDIYKSFGGSESRAAAVIRARVFVIVSAQDHCVNPAPALHFANVLGAKKLILTGNQGHSAPGAEMKKVGPAIERFLSKD